LRAVLSARTQSGTACRLNGKLMPKIGNKGIGNLLAVVEVRTPTEWPDRERMLLQDLAQPPSRDDETLSGPQAS